MHRTCQNKESVPESQHPAAYRQRTALKRYRKSESETLMCCPYHARQLIERHSQLHYLTISIKCWLLQSTIKQKYQDNHLQAGKSISEITYKECPRTVVNESWNATNSDFSLNYLWEMLTTPVGVITSLGNFYRSNTMQRNSKSNQQK